MRKIIALEMLLGVEKRKGYCSKTGGTSRFTAGRKRGLRGVSLGIANRTFLISCRADIST